MPRQLSFDLPILKAMGREDFFVSTSNAAAVALIEGWQGWPSRKLILTGPPGSGKTHLAHVWASLAKATIIDARTLKDADIPQLATSPVAVEDAQRIGGQPEAENALFHLHNLVLAEGHSLLLTASNEPQFWALALADLASRMEGTPAARIEPPDDGLLAAVMMKLFADRQLRPTPETIPYLVQRMPRSFETARDVVEDLDAMALDRGKPINRRLAALALDNLAN